MALFFKRVVSEYLKHLRYYKARSIGVASANTDSTSREYHLSPAELKYFADNGYIIIKQLFETPSVNKLKQHFIDICDRNELKNVTVVKEKQLIDSNLKQEHYIYKIQDILNDEIFMTYSEDPRLLHVISQFIGDDITALNCMLINKPPGTARHMPHQDMYYFPIRPMEKMVVAWTALDTTAIENGCLYVIPGSHKLEILPHTLSKDSKKFFHQLLEEEKYAPLESRQHLEMEPGDTVFYHPHLIHGSGPNVTKRCRKSMTIHYFNSNCIFADIRGTVQEQVLVDYELIRKGESYQDMMRSKSKIVKGMRPL